MESESAPTGRKRKERKWKYVGSNPTTRRKYFVQVDLPKLKPADESTVPEAPPEEEHVPNAQRPSGGFDPDADDSWKEWTDH